MGSWRNLINNARGSRNNSSTPPPPPMPTTPTNSTATTTGSDCESNTSTPPTTPLHGATAAATPPGSPSPYVTLPQPQLNAGLRHNPHLGQPVVQSAHGAQQGRLTYNAAAHGMVPVYTERGVEETEERIREGARVRRAEAERAPVGCRATLAEKIRFFEGR